MAPGRRLYIYETTAEGYSIGLTAHDQWLASQVINAVSFFAVFIVLFLISIRMLKHKNEFELFVGLIMSHQMIHCIAETMSIDPTSPGWEIIDITDPVYQTGYLASNFLHGYTQIMIVSLVSLLIFSVTFVLVTSRRFPLFRYGLPFLCVMFVGAITMASVWLSNKRETLPVPGGFLMGLSLKLSKFRNGFILAKLRVPSSVLDQRCSLLLLLLFLLQHHFE